MPKYRADFDVKSDLVFPGADLMTIRGAGDQFEMTLRNAELDAAGHPRGLIAQIVADCDSIERVARMFRDLLIEQLDLLTFSTHAAFSVEQCRRVLEWEPHEKSRRLIPMKKFDPRYPPSPDLRKEILQSVEMIAHSGPAEYVLNALRHFRYGVIETQPEEQFQQFWRAIEIIAEGKKDGRRVPIQCSKCGGALRCEQCNTEPTRRPMSRQAILQLLQVRLKDSATALFQRLTKVRDQITHGRRVANIEAEIGVPLAQVTNEAAAAAWYAIADSLPKQEGQIHLMHRNGEFARGDLIAAADTRFEYQGDAPQPTEEQIPVINMDLTVRFAPVPDGQEALGGS